jgi:hypothetical protein
VVPIEMEKHAKAKPKQIKVSVGSSSNLGSGFPKQVESASAKPAENKSAA